MTPYVHAVRALTTVLFRKLAIPLAWFVGIIFFIVFALIILFAVVISSWWLLLLIVAVPALLLASALGAFGWIISEKLLPRKLRPDEQKQLKQLSDKIVGIAEARATPLPILGFYVARDLIERRKKGYVETLINDTVSLRSDFTRLVNLFR